MGIEIKAKQFENWETIPKIFSCEWGDNIPTLYIKNISEKTKSIILIVDDPDAPIEEPFVHWILRKNIIQRNEITIFWENLSEFQEWSNTWGSIGWIGPCPPKWHGTHRYFFKIYEVDKKINLNSWIYKNEILNEIEWHIISSNQIMWTYTRN